MSPSSTAQPASPDVAADGRAPATGGPRPRRALVLGASGRLGRAAAEAFAAAGWHVVAQSRRAGSIAWPRGVVALGADLADPAAVARAAAGASVVVHAVNPAYMRWEQEALPLARAGLEVARRLDALFLLPGNVYAFGSAMPPLLAEDTPQRPDTSKGRLRAEMEALMAERAAAGQRCAVLRAGDFYGAGSGSWLDLAIVRGLRRGRLVYPGPTDRAHAWAYLPDLARAAVALAERDRQRPRPGFERHHFAGHTLTGSELLDAVEQAAAGLGLRPAGGLRRGGMPWGLIRLAGLVVPSWRAIAEMAYLWRVPHALDGRALREAVGELPSTPVAEAMRQALLDLGFAGVPAGATPLPASR